MASELKLTRLLSELTKLTSKGQLDWRIKDAPDSLSHGTNDIFPLYYETDYKDQSIGLAQRRYQAYDGDHDRFYWAEEIILLFIDIRNRITWETSSPHAALYTLFETVREQAADVEGILKRLLSDDEDEL